MFDGAVGIWRGIAVMFLLTGVLALGLRVTSCARVDTDEPAYRRAY